MSEDDIGNPDPIVSDRLARHHEAIQRLLDDSAVQSLAIAALVQVGALSGVWSEASFNECLASLASTRWPDGGPEEALDRMTAIVEQLGRTPPGPPRLVVDNSASIEAGD